MSNSTLDDDGGGRAATGVGETSPGTEGGDLRAASATCEAMEATPFLGGRAAGAEGGSTKREINKTKRSKKLGMAK